MSAKRIEAIIEREEAAMQERVEAQVRPLIQASFDRLHAKYPDFERIIFGNGTCLFVFKEGSRYDTVLESNGMERLPRAFHSLLSMCQAISFDYPTDDIYPTGEYPSRCKEDQ